MTELPQDWTPPPRGVERVSVTPDGPAILCDCGTETVLVIEAPENVIETVEQSFICDGCQSVHWFTITPTPRG